jgi:hypothetical protein
MMTIGCSAADDWNIARNRPIKLNIVLLSFQANCSRRRKLCGWRNGNPAKRRCAAARRALFAIGGGFPVSSNARAHACNEIDSPAVFWGYFMKRDVFALAQLPRLSRAL